MQIFGGGGSFDPHERGGGVKRRREDDADDRYAKKQKRELLSLHDLAALSNNDFQKIPNVYQKVQTLLSSVSRVDSQIAADLNELEKKVSLNPKQNQLVEQIKKLAQGAQVSKPPRTEPETPQSIQTSSFFNFFGTSTTNIWSTVGNFVGYVTNAYQNCNQKKQAEEFKCFMENLEAVSDPALKPAIEKQIQDSEALIAYIKGLDFLHSTIPQLKDILPKEASPEELVRIFTTARYANKIKAGMHTLRESEVDQIIAFFSKTAEIVKEPLLKNIVDRYHQIASMPKEKHGLETHEILSIAYFIEGELLRDSVVMDRYVKKTITKLSRTVSTNEKKDVLYLHSKNKVKILNAEGTSKKVQTSVSIPLKIRQQTPDIAAHAVLKDNADIEDMKNEVIIHKQLSGRPGIWPLHTCFEFTKGEGIQKISTMSELATCSLAECSSDPRYHLNFSQQLQCAIDLLSGIETLQSENRIHGDLKHGNVVIKINPEGSVKAGLIDFGCTYYEGEQVDPFIPHYGLYGSQYITPPEVLQAGKSFAGDCKKVEDWVGGCILYSLVNKNQIPWYVRAGKTTIKDLNDDVEKWILTPRRKLEKSTNVNDQDKFLLVIYKLLDPNPQKRLSAGEAKRQIESIRDRMVPG